MNRLNESHFSFKCPMNLDDMKSTERGRFCSKCKKEVFDLTNCSLDEVRALEQKHGPLCGSIRMAQVATVAISLAAAACQEKQQNGPIVVGEIAAPPSQHEGSGKTNPQPTAGSICLPPAKPEGNAGATHEPPDPSVKGRIMLPRNDEEGKNKSVDPTPTPPNE